MEEEHTEYENEDNSMDVLECVRWDKSESEPKRRNCFIWYWIIAGFIFAGAISSSLTSFNHDATKCKEVLTENREILDNLRVGIDECRQFEKPSVILFLYSELTESAVDELIATVSNYASCNLTGSRTEAIDLPMSELQSIEVNKDYGLIIERYRRELEERSVMVVRGLERVPGVAAQAFHSLCDEFSPVVGKAMFVFTMRVDSYEPGVSDFKLVEATLKRNWNDLDVDIFEPLLARITSMIVRLK